MLLCPLHQDQRRTGNGLHMPNIELGCDTLYGELGQVLASVQGPVYVYC
jgi:hypothetical protein